MKKRPSNSPIIVLSDTSGFIGSALLKALHGLRNYRALKNFMILFWLAMTLIYKEFESIALELIAESGLKTTYKNKLFEYSDFVYYKISKAIVGCCQK